LTDDEGRLAGAHLSMAAAVRNIQDFAGVSLADALRMASTAPAAVLGLDRELGRIAPGDRAGLTFLDDRLETVGAVVDGQQSPKSA
jgi:N-acetylglucosamine-6-phosphate deacetylase